MKRRFGDRKDGRLLRELDSLHFITGILYPNRCDNEAYIAESIDLAPIQAYIDEKNKTAAFHYTFFHVVVAALAKTITLRKKMNRFIVNSNFYERNEVSLSFVVKKEFADNAHEALAMLHTKDTDTMATIHESIRSQVQDCRSEKVDSSTDSMNLFNKMPRGISKALVHIIMWLDKHGWVPSSLIETDPYYSSCVISNLGSIRLKCGYHHLTNWGTCSCFCIIGEKTSKPVYDEHGHMEMHEVLELGLTIDERIADGYYYAKTIRLLKYLLSHPEELEKPLGQEVSYE